MWNPAWACVFFGLQRIFKFCQICYKHFKIVRFCIEIQLSIFSGKKIRLSGNHRSQFLTWQPWDGAECLSHWRLRHCWSLTSASPTPPHVCPLLRPVGGWVWLPCPTRTVPWEGLRPEHPSPPPGEISCLFFIFLTHPHPSNSAQSPLAHERLIWHPNTKRLCLPVNSHRNDHWSYLFCDQLYLDSWCLSYRYLGGNLNSISFYSL